MNITYTTNTRYFKIVIMFVNYFMIVTKLISARTIYSLHYLLSTMNLVSQIITVFYQYVGRTDLIAEPSLSPLS